MARQVIWTGLAVRLTFLLQSVLLLRLDKLLLSRQGVSSFFDVSRYSTSKCTISVKS